MPRQAKVLVLAAVLVFIRTDGFLAQGALQVGYSVYSADTGNRLPAGAALFRVSDSTGVVVSEAGVGAAEPIAKGRVFVDEVGTKMGLALVNANASAASITFILRDPAGTELARRSDSLTAHQHLARYVSDLLPDKSVGVRGSLSFESSQPLAAVTLRENRNSRNEPLYTTLPVTDLSVVPSNGSVVFPQIAAGGGYTTELLLMNPTTNAMSGDVLFYGSDGKPVSVQNGNQTVSQMHYTIAANGIFRAVLTSPTPISGWAAAVPSGTSPAPSGSVIFQFNPNNQVVTETGVGATPAIKAARIFVDNAQTQTGVAIVNPSGSTANLTLTLMDGDGTVEGTTTRTLPAGNHLALYVNELFSTVTSGFTGLMDIRSDVDVASVTLKLTVNARGDLVLTTLPVADLANARSSTTLIFPQIAIGVELSTRLILISTDSATAASGKLSFYQSDGTNMVLPMGQQTGSQFPYQLSAGGGRQFYPGNSARVAAIRVIDPSDGQITTEIAINEGNRVRARSRLSDTTGAFRDDFDVTIQSLDTSVATVDSSGSIKGQHAGFSTLTITSQNVVATATATVAKVNSGGNGFQIQGIAQDLANRLYLAASSEQAILLAQDIQQTPITYAGIPNNPGLKDGVRLGAQFYSPSFLAFDQARGTLYVSDTANNVIRRVNPGNPGTVETLAGTRAAGGQDGPLLQARFNNPQGTALDSRGNLWVADTGNHTVRRINLQTGTVQTIAGMPGTPGLVDGQGSSARLNGPIGLAIENETTAQEVERLRLGQPPPPVRVLVADSGNNVIRRVTEDGQVETLGMASANGTSPQYKPIVKRAIVPATSLLFTAPTAVAVDSSGNIFVTERTTGQVKTILTTGNVVGAAQRNTFSSPSGIVITSQGRVVIADRKHSAQEIVYGLPEISTVDPVTSRGGAVTIRGRNFSPDSTVVFRGVVAAAVSVQDSTTISVNIPPLPSGLTTLSVQNRAGLAQAPVLIAPVPLTELLPGQIETVAGGADFLGDGSNASRAPLYRPQSLAIDRAGDLFIADTALFRVRKVAAETGIITTVAGNGKNGFSGDGGPATAATLGNPSGVAVDGAGNLFIADTVNNRIRKVAAGTGIITTAAGNGKSDFSGDGGPATAAAIDRPRGIAVDVFGSLFIVDTSNDRIRKVAYDTGIITTVWQRPSNGLPGYLDGIAVDRAGNLFIATEEVTVKVAAGTGIATRVVEDPYSAPPIAVDGEGNLFFTDINQIRKVAADTGIITTVAGSGQYGFSGDGGLATAAALGCLGGRLGGIAVDGVGNLFIADSCNGRTRKVTASTGIITTVAGNGQTIAVITEFQVFPFSGDGGPATAATLGNPSGVAVDGAGNLFVADTVNNRIRKVAAGTGIITTVAGNGQTGFSGDGGPATAAALSIGIYAGIAVDVAGNLFLIDGANHRIRKVAADTGIIMTVAGNGQAGFSGDGGPATAAALGYVGGSLGGIAVDVAGNLFLADNNRIRKVAADTGIITTVVGNGKFGFSGDGGAATAATLGFPSGVAVDRSGNLFIADFYNDRIRKVAADTGIITTVAGNGSNVVFCSPGCYFGDGGPATAATLRDPVLIAVDWAGNLFLIEIGNGNQIRKVATDTGIITRVAGNGRAGFSGDGGPATASTLVSPGGMAVDAAGNLFISDPQNNRIRAIRGPIP